MSYEIDAYLDAVLREPLAAAREDDRAVGCVGFDLPLDIRCATPNQMRHLPWRRHNGTPNADKWLESAFPGWARSILEDWIAGAFDMFESVVFSRGDDASQRLYYYVCELGRMGVLGGPRPVILDVATIPRQSSVLHCEHALNKMLATLGLSAFELEQGISRANEYRKLYARLDQDRSGPGHIYENIGRASLFGDLLPALDGIELPVVAGNRRLLLAGSVPADDGFHLAAQHCGWNIVGEFHPLSLSRHGECLDVRQADPLRLVARHLNTNSHGPRAFFDRSSRLLEEVSRRQVQAVVLWLTEDDEAHSWHVARQHQALLEKGVDVLVMVRRRWDYGDGSKEELMKFLRGLDQ